MEYKELLLAHLGVYRRNVLGIKAPGTFRYRGRDVPVEHVIPIEESADAVWLTIPESMRQTVRAYCEANAVRRHRYFHHLNSSQAFALSLFVPFFEGGPEASASLLRAIGISGALAAWLPERIPDSDEGTNLDAWWTTAEGVQVFCEVKLTESEFGSAADDVAHREKLRKIYAPVLQGHVEPSLLDPAQFFQSYQILRNLWHGAKEPSSRVVFVFPRQQEMLTKQLLPVLDQITSDLRDRVVIAYAEDVLARIAHDVSCPPRLREYAEELAEKYLLHSPTPA